MNILATEGNNKQNEVERINKLLSTTSFDVCLNTKSETLIQNLNMKFKYFIILFLTGLLISLFARLFTILHLSIAGFTSAILYLLGTSIQIISVIPILIGIIRIKSLKEFLSK